MTSATLDTAASATSCAVGARPSSTKSSYVTVLRARSRSSTGSPFRSEVEPRQIQLIRLRSSNLRDREILDREARRVEQRDVTTAAAALGVAGEHAADIG